MQNNNRLSAFDKGSVVISIDDGNADDFRLYETILLKYNLPATFNIVTSRIGEEYSLTKDQLRILYDNPSMEIAAHGHTHKNDDEDIVMGADVLRDWLGITENTIGFASPGSRMKNDFIEENAEHLRSLGLLYVRTSGNPKPNKRHLEIQEKLANKEVSGYVIKNIPQLIYSFDGLCVNSVVVLNATDPNDLKKLVDIAAEEKACIVFMFHRTKRLGEWNYDDLYSYDYNKFEKFAEYLVKKRNAGMIDILTNKQAFLAGLPCTKRFSGT